MKQNLSTERREFLVKAGSLACLGLCGATFSALVNSCEYTKVPAEPTGGSFTLDINDISGLQTVGGSYQYQKTEADKPYNIIRLSDTKFLVVTAICTHQGCAVGLPEAPGADMVCGCHLAAYASSDEEGGKVKRQPFGGGSATDLKRYENSYDAEKKMLTIFT